MALRVLFATDYIHFPQGGGGGERNTHEICLAMRRHGVVPAVMSGLYADRSRLTLVNRLKRGLLTRHQYPRDTGCGYPVFRGWAPSGAAEVAGRFRPDVVVVQSTHPASLLRAFTQLKLPTVAYQHEVEELDHFRELTGMGVHFLSNSDFTAQRMLDQLGIRSKVVLPLIDRRHYETARQPERVLFVNTHTRKGVDVAFAVAERRPDIQFDFTKAWSHKPPVIADLDRRAKAAGNVTLHDPVRDMRPLYRRARVLLAPSQWEETWGRVATEAHINGIPVVGSNRGGLPQAIGPGGIILEADAPVDEWVGALSDLWDDPERYAAYSAAAKTYSERPDIQPDTIAQNLRDTLAQLAAR